MMLSSSSSSKAMKAELLLHDHKKVVSSQRSIISHAIIVLLPIIGSAFNLAAFILLIAMLGIESVTDGSVSNALSANESKVETMTLILIGSTIIVLVTMMRDIQINVYHRREKSDTQTMRVSNIVAAIANILAYIGLVLLVIFDSNDPSPAPLIHLVGAGMFFVLNSMYGVIHSYLLWKQTQKYPTWCKIVFTILPMTSITCYGVFIYGYFAAASTLEDLKDYLAGGEVGSMYPEYEWLSIMLSIILSGFMSYLFHVDSVDDELREFFCFRRNLKPISGGGKK
jgi:hypothetical protein